VQVICLTRPEPWHKNPDSPLTMGYNVFTTSDVARQWGRRGRCEAAPDNRIYSAAKWAAKINILKEKFDFLPSTS